jgi:AbrB family looped-hinge helix DNA binding protein
MPKISPRGKISVPKSIRDFLSITPGDEVDFQIAGDRVFLFKKAQRNRKNSFRNYLGYLSNLHGTDSDVIIEELRGQFDDIGS